MTNSEVNGYRDLKKALMTTSRVHILDKGQKSWQSSTDIGKRYYQRLAIEFEHAALQEAPVNDDDGDDQINTGGDELA
ncbi:hypothetical protein N0V88_007351 [Collariella sp. IMI 366227]|nr:hypothetical protein N0V88_007351 [Collariella sp. IMI 366227]